MTTNTEVSTTPVDLTLTEATLSRNDSVDCDSIEIKPVDQFKMPSPNWRPIRKKSLRNVLEFSLEHAEYPRSGSEDLASAEDSGCDSYKADSTFRTPSSNLRTIRRKKTRSSGLSQQYLEELHQYVEDRSRQLQSRMKVMHMSLARRCNKFGYSPDVFGRITDY